MKQKLLFNLFKSSLLVLLFVTSCTEDTDRPEWPLYADVFYSVDDKQVAFTALTHSATSWSWDFGDGNTSSEQNPVHVYETGGYYTAQLTAKDGSGNTETSEVELAIALTPYVLLTGGPTATEGKTWKMSAAHSSNDLFANADANLSIYDEDIPSLPSGAFSLFLNMGEVYDDEFTFYHDGSYSHDTKEDEAAFAGIVNQMISTGGANIVNTGGQDYGLCTASFTPEENATFTYVESEDFTVNSVYGADGTVTYEDVSTLDFSGNEFIGLWDVQRKVILQEINDGSMRLVMFMSASPDYYPLNTHALVITFEVVN